METSKNIIQGKCRVKNTWTKRMINKKERTPTTLIAYFNKTIPSDFKNNEFYQIMNYIREGKIPFTYFLDAQNFRAFHKFLYLGVKYSKFIMAQSNKSKYTPVVGSKYYSYDFGDDITDLNLRECQEKDLSIHNLETYLYETEIEYPNDRIKSLDFSGGQIYSEF